MTRVAFRMRLKPGCEAEYKARHDAIWPELAAVIRESGTRNYSIFRSELDLFAYLEMEPGSPVRAANEPVHPVLQRWWETMEPLMECNEDHSPVVWPMEEVFHLD
jgi:L-rhamnose mutarotase